MVNPSIPQMASAALANNEDVVYNDSNYDPIDEQNMDNASLPNASSIISTTSSSHYNINPPPGKNWHPLATSIAFTS